MKKSGSDREIASMERISSGIVGLDEMIEGGYPRNRSIMVTGGPGVGKTIMSLHFINSACKSGLKCLYLASEETPEELRLQAGLLGFDIREYEDNNLLEIVPALKDRMSDVQWQRGKPEKTSIFKKPIDRVNRSDANVVVIDNIGTYTLDISLGRFREQIDFLIHSIRDKGKSGMVICDESVDNRYNNVALYAVHGAIHMLKRENPFTGNVERVMNIVKMRGTKTPLEYIKYNIDNQGIRIQNNTNDPMA